MNTREKLSWTLLGVAVFFGIAAVSTDTSFFKNASLTGWLSLSGETNRLTVAGDALLLDGSTVGGDTIWNNTGGVIAPASGQDTNVLRFTSGLADNTTNVAVVVDTDEAWTGEAKLLSFRNNGTQKSYVSQGGSFVIGDTAAAFWGATRPGLQSIVDTASGDSATHSEVVLASTQDGWNSSYATWNGFAQRNGTTGGRTSGIYFDSSVASTNLYLDITADSSVTNSKALYLRMAGTSAPYNQSYVWFKPLAASGDTPFTLNAGVAQSAGSLFKLQNVGTNKFAIGFDGATTIAQSDSEPDAPAAGYFTLFGIDNGGGKMVLKVRFPTGASQTVATEP